MCRKNLEKWKGDLLRTTYQDSWIWDRKNANKNQDIKSANIFKKSFRKVLLVAICEFDYFFNVNKDRSLIRAKSNKKKSYKKQTKNYVIYYL